MYLEIKRSLEKINRKFYLKLTILNNFIEITFRQNTQP